MQKLINMNILQEKKYYLLAKFTYSALGNALEKQTKMIEDQGKMQIKATEDHGKQLIMSTGKKDSIELLKQK